jgi:hypothetical protein
MSYTGDAEIISKFRDMGVSNRTDMLSKEVAWIPDNNGNSYNGQIIFDLSSMGQTNRWINYSEAYIQIPYVVSMVSNTNYTTAVTADSLVIKDGFWQLIDNILIEFNQKTVCQSQNFTNVHTHFKMLTSSSANDMFLNGSSLGFTGDDVTNVTYSAGGATSGIGYINNTTALNSSTGARRRFTTGYDVAARATALPTVTAADQITSGTSYYANDAGVNEARKYYWVAMATIRLSDITDFFSKIPVCHTTDLRLTLTYNSSRIVINTNATVSPNSLVTNLAHTQLSGHSCPFMISDLAHVASSTVTIESNVLKTSQIDPPNKAISACRLYLPLYKIADNVSLAMIQSFPTTKFNYNDIYSYVIPDITANQSFTHTLTTGLTNPQYVVVIPFPKTNAAIGCATYQSPFDTAPGTSSAIILKDFNVQIAGLNVFQSNERYDFEQFLDELSSLNAINGNNTLGLTSGVLDFNKFQRGYRMYVADLSRREPSQDNVIKSITITGTPSMNAGTACELICFVAYKKSMTIQTATGAVLD